MPDPTIGTLTPTDPAKVIARAAEKLGVRVPPVDEAMVERMAKVIGDEIFGWVDPIGTPNTWAVVLGTARAAIAAM